MSDLELIDAVAQKTGEDSHEIRRRGFVLTGPDEPSTGTRSATAVGRRSSTPARRPGRKPMSAARSRQPERRDLLTGSKIPHDPNK